MNIVIHLSNHLISEAIHQLLVGNGYDNVVTDANMLTNGATPHVFLVDITTLNHNVLNRYPDAKFLLIDLGMEPEEIIAIFLAYKIQGVLSPRTELHVFRKALKVVSEGQVWIDDTKVKSSLDDAGVISVMGKISGITGREKQIIGHVCQGLSNREIAQVLALSEATVRTHLVNIFRKLSITKRSKLMTLAMNRQQALSA
jgi:DNA-binding NarL/FixJ family response regulator